MTPEFPPRLAEQSDDAGALLASAAQLPDWHASQRARAWQRLDRAAHQRATFWQRPLGLVVAAGTAALVGAAVVWWSMPRFSSTSRSPTAEPVASAPLPAAAPVPRELERGRMSGTTSSTGRGLVVLTPQLRIVVAASTRYEVASYEVSSVVVHQGEAFVQRRGGGPRVALRSGEQLLSTDPRLGAVDVVASPMAVASSPPPPAAEQRVERTAATVSPSAGCSEAAVREPCLRREANGTGLAAQNALLALALLYRDRHEPDRALAVLEESLERFPRGALLPEVRLNRVKLAADTPAQVLTAADEYLEHHSVEPSAVWVALLKADTLYRLRRFADAQLAYGRAAVLGDTPEFVAEAKYFEGLAARQVGDAAAAKAAFSASLAAAPAGPRADAAHQQLK